MLREEAMNLRGHGPFEAGIFGATKNETYCRRCHYNAAFIIRTGQSCKPKKKPAPQPGGGK